MVPPLNALGPRGCCRRFRPFFPLRRDYPGQPGAEQVERARPPLSRARQCRRRRGPAAIAAGPRESGRQKPESPEPRITVKFALLLPRPPDGAPETLVLLKVALPDRLSM
jgi:hypothetical protein